jgi:hypothetical protein
MIDYLGVGQAENARFVRKKRVKRLRRRTILCSRLSTMAVRSRWRVSFYRGMENAQRALSGLPKRSCNGTKYNTAPSDRLLPVSLGLSSC